MLSVSLDCPFLIAHRYFLTFIYITITIYQRKYVWWRTDKKQCSFPVDLTCASWDVLFFIHIGKHENNSITAIYFGVKKAGSSLISSNFILITMFSKVWSRNFYPSGALEFTKVQISKYYQPVIFIFIVLSFALARPVTFCSS
jgi:hypothetical protein